MRDTNRVLPDGAVPRDVTRVRLPAAETTVVRPEVLPPRVRQGPKPSVGDWLRLPVLRVEVTLGRCGVGGKDRDDRATRATTIDLAKAQLLQLRRGSMQKRHILCIRGGTRWPISARWRSVLILLFK